MDITRLRMLEIIAAGGCAVAPARLLARNKLLELFEEDAANKHPRQVARREYAAEPGRMLSMLGFGMMRLPERKGRIDEELADKMIDYAYRHGVNYYDTAWMYLGGKSQYYTGKVLEKYDRKSLYIVNKLPGNPGCQSLEKAKETFETQLKACRTEYFDNYFCHSISNWDDFQKRYLGMGILDYLKSERDRGRIRHLGFSFHGGERDLEQFLKVKDAGWEFVMLQINANDMRGAGGKYYDMVRAANLPIFVMEPLHGGRLANVNVAARGKLAELKPGLSPAGWAFRYIASRPGVAVCLSGMRSVEDVVDNVNTFCDFKPLTDAEVKAYYDILAKYQGKNLVGCTGCRYCDPCEQGVNIAGVFELVNTARIEGLLGPNGDGDGASPRDIRKFLAMYRNKVGPKADATRCTACEECSPRCPQHLDIDAEMKKVNALVEKVSAGVRG